MERELTGKRPTFHQERRRFNLYLTMILLGLILAGIWVLRDLQRGQIVSPFEPTPTPTRMSESYFMEAQAYFEAGKLDDPSNNLAAMLHRSTTPSRPTRQPWLAIQGTLAPGQSWPASRLILPVCCATTPNASPA